MAPRPTSPGLRRRHTIVLAGVMAAGVLIALAARPAMFADTIDALTHVDPFPLAVALVISMGSVANRGFLYRYTHRAVGVNTPLGPMIRVTAAAYALNKTVRTGGAGGVALFVRHGSRHHHSAGRVTAAYLLGGLGGHIGLAVLFAAAVGTAAWAGTLNSLWLGASVGLAVYLAVTAVLVYAALRSRATLQRIYSVASRTRCWLSACLGRPARLAGRRAPAVDEFFDAVQHARCHPWAFVSALGHAVGDKVLGGSVLACAVLATGGGLNVRTIISAYAIALVASMIGVLPAGLGAVEASLAAVLTGQGVPPSATAAAIVLFRAIDLWVPLIVGSLAARTLWRREPVLDNVPLDAVPLDGAAPTPATANPAQFPVLAPRLAAA